MRARATRGRQTHRVGPLRSAVCAFAKPGPRRHNDPVQLRRRFLAGIAALTAVALCPQVRAASCDPIVTFAEGKVPAREIFVSPDGDDAGGDGTAARPFRSIGRARQEVGPGDAIRLLPGEHAPGTYLENLAGTAEAPIWLGGASDQPRPVIRGGGQALHLSRARYVVVERLEVAGATQNGINCDDGGDYADPEAARHIVFRDLVFRDIGTGGNQDALKLSGVNDHFVLDCEFARVSAGSAIDQVGCHDGVIARCAFSDMGSNAVQCKGGSENIEIRWNRFVNAGARAINIGGSTGFQYFRPPLSTTQPNAESRNIRVIANVFEGSDAPVAFVGTVGSLAANNTVVDPDRWILRILQETLTSEPYVFLPCGGNAFRNNLVYYNRGRLSTHLNIGPNTDPASFGFSNNLWFAHDRPEGSQPVLPVAEADAVVGLDPRFRNAAGGDYEVASDGPAAGAGLRLDNVKADLRERCYADPPTIGALEAMPPGGAPAPDRWEHGEGGVSRRFSSCLRWSSLNKVAAQAGLRQGC